MSVVDIPCDGPGADHPLRLWLRCGFLCRRDRGVCFEELASLALSEGRPTPAGGTHSWTLPVLALLMYWLYRSELLLPRNPAERPRVGSWLPLLNLRPDGIADKAMWAGGGACNIDC